MTHADRAYSAPQELEDIRREWKPQLKEGWLVRTIVYSHGGELWEFNEEKPHDSYEYLGGDGNGAHRPSQVKRIMYFEVAQ